MRLLKNRLFLGETEKIIPRSRPAVHIAGSAGRGKGAKLDRSHAQRSEHGEDPPFDAPDHPAAIANGWPNLMGFPLPTPSTTRGKRKQKKHAIAHFSTGHATRYLPRFATLATAVYAYCGAAFVGGWDKPGHGESIFKFLQKPWRITTDIT
jgi:hypothetical protein